MGPALAQAIVGLNKAYQAGKTVKNIANRIGAGTAQYKEQANRAKIEKGKKLAGIQKAEKIKALKEKRAKADQEKIEKLKQMGFYPGYVNPPKTEKKLNIPKPPKPPKVPANPNPVKVGK